jgi:2-amino-4-hydroxy-6-hydroxymethyldihydropteridine diphosphokinase
VTKLDTSEKQANSVYLGIGSNLGNRISNIEKAKLLLIENNVNFISTSSYFETPSWPDPKKTKFINIVIKTKCTLKPTELLRLCKLIELKLGRKKTPKNSPRECDIDIIDFNGLTSKGKLNLPHKMMHKRNFVLFPLFEIEKKWLHPLMKVGIKQLIYSLPNNDIRSIKQF